MLTALRTEGHKFGQQLEYAGLCMLLVWNCERIWMVQAYLWFSFETP
jgi:hypothetical protein